MVKSSNGVEVLKMHRLDGDSSLKAYADVTFGDAFIVKGLRVVEGKNGLFVSMPSRKAKNGKWYDTAYPLTKEFRQLLNEIVLETYESQ